MRPTPILLCLLLTSCASLPAAETEAFQKLATSNREAFDTIAQNEHETASRAVIDQLMEGNGTLVSSQCEQATADKPCISLFSASGVEIQVTKQAKQTRRLVGLIERYGTTMAELAAAKDLDELNGKIDGVATAIGVLGTAVGLAPVAPLTKLFAAGVKGSYKEKRRLVLLKAAQSAQPLVARAAHNMTRQAEALKRNIDILSRPGLNSAELDVPKTIDALGKIRKGIAGEPDLGSARRARLLAEQAGLEQQLGQAINAHFAGTAHIQAAREIDTDFSSLEKGHQAVLSSLSNKKPDVGESLALLTDYTENLKDLKNAL